MAHKVTEEMVLEAIKGSQGLVTKIQRNLEKALKESVCWDTVSSYIHKWESCEAAVKAEKEMVLDLAENNVFKELVNGDISTSKWYLRLKGRDRGYVETQEIQMSKADPLNINLQGELFGEDELAACSGVEVSKGGENGGESGQ